MFNFRGERPGVGGEKVKFGSEEADAKEPESKVVRDVETETADGNTIGFKAETTKGGGFKISTGLRGFGKPKEEGK